MKSAAIGSLLIVFLVMGLTITGNAFAAFPRKPHKFWGTATLDGEVVPEGSLVTARAAGKVVAKDEVGADGSYSLLVPPSTAGSASTSRASTPASTTPS